MRGRYGEDRIRVSADWFGEIIGDGLALATALDGLEAAMALAGGAQKGQEPNEDALSFARRAGEVRDHLKFLLAAADPAFVYFLETRGRGVSVNAVLPSTMDTPANRAAMPAVDPNTWVPVDAVAGAIAYLASESAAHVSGTLLAI